MAAPTEGRLQPGRPWPLGATAEAGGVNFAVPSAHAEAMLLCLFDDAGQVELQRLPLPARTGDVWHGFLPGAAAGLVYGYRAHGPWQPAAGQRFNDLKLLLDPWAREIVGRHQWRQENVGADPRDNATFALKARVLPADDGFDWQGDRRLLTPLADTVLYELHVKGFTRQHPGVPAEQRGTYAGLASDAAVAHLKRLGVSAVSLLPVHQHIDEERLVAMGLSNYWGYNTIGFFAPEPSYAATPDARTEFRQMVRRLHAEGIEVILDVVFNHSAETDEHGPTISFRGLDNAGWYRLRHESRALYENDTGCGNTLDIRQPRVLQLVMDSLRWWVGEMHVDGFRFDLAPVLGRGNHGFDRDGAFFMALRQDPLLQGVKLIAEPWDIGLGGYQLGQFPAGWLEWNDKFRDTMRAFWLGHPAHRGDFARRLAGSADLFHQRGRAPGEGVNYVVSHDGFTLRDLLTYEQRRNQANGEDNRDGHGHNLGWNCGQEGETDDAAVQERRARLARALLATVLLAQGTPMIAAGDELGHTQDGNNNPYCQDNAITWIDWAAADEALIDFTARLIGLRRTLLPLGERWYSGFPDAEGQPDLAWFGADGRPLGAAQWHDGDARALGAWIGQPGRAQAPLLLLVNADADDTAFVLPEAPAGWQRLLDTAETATGTQPAPAPAASPLRVRGRSLVLLAATPAP
ncbi:glycogen debranching protein GlgX [Aquincola sp. J276]|uniref:glycogen debranching protein GlgX n=1 Tax=Aquincola sp. J276 TaxID=2898432 RepID=UPI0021512F83|nr:glycogen debranching protein GlgX [Aquincola sp. J276]MCR5868287.1 glycogen debranching protein GlgX [Aquincola sp. J276]